MSTHRGPPSCRDASTPKPNWPRRQGDPLPYIKDSTLPASGHRQLTRVPVSRNCCRAAGTRWLSSRARTPCPAAACIRGRFLRGRAAGHRDGGTRGSLPANRLQPVRERPGEAIRQRRRGETGKRQSREIDCTCLADGEHLADAVPDDDLAMLHVDHSFWLVALEEHDSGAGLRRLDAR
jgi:hypothetical protein